jgi:hypothetical protein
MGGATELISVLQYGSMGLLLLVLAGGFVLLRGVAAKIGEAFTEHARATKELSQTIQASESRATERHTATHEKVRDLIERQTDEIKEHVTDVKDDVIGHMNARIQPLEYRLLGRVTPQPFPAVKKPPSGGERT